MMARLRLRNGTSHDCSPFLVNVMTALSPVDTIIMPPLKHGTQSVCADIPCPCVYSFMINWSTSVYSRLIFLSLHKSSILVLRLVDHSGNLPT